MTGTEGIRQSTTLTSSGSAFTGAGRLHRVIVSPNATTFHVDIYDNTAGSGTLVGQIRQIVSTGGTAVSPALVATNQSETFDVDCKIGCYIDIVGGNVSVSVIHS